MPAAVRGAASPWFTSAGSDLLVVKVSVKYLFATTSEWIADRLRHCLCREKTLDFSDFSDI
jgi:hypothetical protein